MTLTTRVALAISPYRQAVSDEDFRLFDELFVEKTLPLYISDCWQGEHMAITERAALALYGQPLSDDEDTPTALCKFSFDKNIQGYVITPNLGTLVLLNKKTHQRLANIESYGHLLSGNGDEGTVDTTQSWILDLNNDEEPDILRRSAVTCLSPLIDRKDCGTETYSAEVWQHGQFIHDRKISQEVLKKRYRTLMETKGLTIEGRKQ